MQWLSPTLLAIQVLSSLSIIVLVLLQQGKGADMGSSFGGGSAGSLFGAAGAANFLSRTTRWAAIVFFAATIGLAYTAHNTGNSILDGGGLMQDYQPSSTETAPAGASSVPSLPGSANGSAVPQAPAAPANEVPAAPSANEVPAPVAAPAPAQTPAPATEAAPADQGEAPAGN
ncbi:preprotein translocase subunit SecG [Pusillimonas sp. CC-YST705]|uniref:Protein-export membrane protein SecG n=1 Tax=Mesopusillimonas faecipullorum TaxID=2755040 RepID=A0ABS8CCW9_9BURK|nr:preprotein translocase subunit SecG [Mesopusillimonas faecipullorum]MCB5363892.1 preprotein translocase subunit SecG [Mesopusillimonas faecipullorum]